MVLTVNHLDLFAITNLIMNLLEIYLLLRLLHPRWFRRRHKNHIESGPLK
jgi:hypothetical protein